jgi:hypothetical protein
LDSNVEQEMGLDPGDCEPPRKRARIQEAPNDIDLFRNVRCATDEADSPSDSAELDTEELSSGKSSYVVLPRKN